MHDDSDIFLGLATLSNNIKTLSAGCDELGDLLKLVNRKSPDYRRILNIYLKKVTKLARGIDIMVEMCEKTGKYKAYLLREKRNALSIRRKLHSNA